MWILAVDGNTIGLGSVSGALVVALGYMLHDRRDTDRRVDKATQAVITAIASERDRAIASEARAWEQTHQLQHELTDALERNRILQFRLQVMEAKGNTKDG